MSCGSPVGPWLIGGSPLLLQRLLGDLEAVGPRESTGRVYAPGVLNDPAVRCVGASLQHHDRLTCRQFQHGHLVRGGHACEERLRHAVRLETLDRQDRKSPSGAGWAGCRIHERSALDVLWQVVARERMGRGWALLHEPGSFVDGLAGLNAKGLGYLMIRRYAANRLRLIGGDPAAARSLPVSGEGDRATEFPVALGVAIY